MDDFDFSSDDWSFLDDNDWTSYQDTVAMDWQPESDWMGAADYSWANNSDPWVSGGDIGLSDTPYDPSFIDSTGGTGSFDLSSLNGILGTVGNFIKSPTGQRVINGGLGAVGAYQGYQNNQAQRDMLRNYMGQLSDPGLAQRRQLLNDSYSNPTAWLNGPEGQAIANSVLNATERRDASLGRFSNPINRTAELQDRLMAGLGNYRAGLSNSITGATSGMQNLGNVINQYGNYDPYKPIGYGLEEIIKAIGNG